MGEIVGDLKSNIDLLGFNSSFRVNELRAFDYGLRNKIRAIVFSDGEDAISLLNRLRSKTRISELVQLENFLRSFKLKDNNYLLSPLYPLIPQTYNNYMRLKSLGLDRQLEYIENLLKNEEQKILYFFDKIFMLNNYIFDNHENKYQLFGEILNEFGYSHFLLRKAIAIKIFDNGVVNKIIDNLINDCGFRSNNVVIGSLFQCYQLEQDYISLKKSVMNFPDRKNQNKYVRDIIRIPFHPTANDEKDLCDLIQSCLQSSFIDALIILFINKDFIDSKYTRINRFFDHLNNNFNDDEKICKYYISLDEINTVEDIFFQQSSAWYEYEFINNYRLLPDNFYDDPDAKYIKINDNLVKKIKINNNDIALNELAHSDNLKCHNYDNIKIIENNGYITKSSLFNFIIYDKKGNDYILEDNLYKLMGSTRDLARTINTHNVRSLASFTDSTEAKIIYYLLISKKSKNESEDYLLRRLIQEVVKNKHSGSLLDYIKSMNENNSSIAYYIYETCTEDFIAKLSHIITSISQITETRAALHRWMGDVTGEKSFTDRARTILIDQQISRVRNELDDHRIYVDSAKFIEWINDDLIREINTVLSGITYKLQTEDTEIPLLYNIIEKAFFEFTSNNIFGIASYLGRRIRHGTFKGHLASIIKNIEIEYEEFLEDSFVNSKWLIWKENFEKNVNIIIRNHLHIQNASKREGLLVPSLSGSEKIEIALSCTQDILKDYFDNNATSVISILVDYCWRLIEVDLRQIHFFLNNKKQLLINFENLIDIKEACNSSIESKEFIREIQHSVSEKVTMMSSWFKRPQSVAPKAALSLLYKAVVAEVHDTFPEFSPELDFGDDQIELMGGAYHVLYDAFYVVIYNAAKHGKKKGIVTREFKIVKKEDLAAVNVIITSEIKDSDNEDFVSSRLKVSSSDDILNAQLKEDRSGIKKLYNLQANDPSFVINKIECKHRKVIVDMSYSVVHT